MSFDRIFDLTAGVYFNSSTIFFKGNSFAAVGKFLNNNYFLGDEEKMESSDSDDDVCFDA